MSGGSWDYLYGRINDATERLGESKCPHRRALGRVLGPIADALHDVEWVDSHDMKAGDEVPAIRKALEAAGGKGRADELTLAELVAEAKRIRDELAEFMVAMDRRKDEG